MFVFGNVYVAQAFPGTRRGYSLVCKQAEMNRLNASAAIWEMGVSVKGTLAVFTEQHKLQCYNPPAHFP